MLISVTNPIVFLCFNSNTLMKPNKSVQYIREKD